MRVQGPGFRVGYRDSLRAAMEFPIPLHACIATLEGEIAFSN